MTTILVSVIALGVMLLGAGLLLVFNASPRKERPFGPLFKKEVARLDDSIKKAEGVLAANAQGVEKLAGRASANASEIERLRASLDGLAGELKSTGDSLQLALVRKTARIEGIENALAEAREKINREIAASITKAEEARAALGAMQKEDLNKISASLGDLTDDLKSARFEAAAAAEDLRERIKTNEGINMRDIGAFRDRLKNRIEAMDAQLASGLQGLRDDIALGSEERVRTHGALDRKLEDTIKAWRLQRAEIISLVDTTRGRLEAAIAETDKRCADLVPMVESIGANLKSEGEVRQQETIEGIKALENEIERINTLVTTLVLQSKGRREWEDGIEKAGSELLKIKKEIHRQAKTAKDIGQEIDRARRE